MTTHPNTQPHVYTPAPMTTMPTVPEQASRFVNPQISTVRPVVVVGNAVTKRSRFVSSCTDVARRTGRLLVRYRYELAPLGVVGTLTNLGWWQYADGANASTVAGYAAVGLAGVAGGVLGMKHKHPHIAHAGAGVALAFGDVAAGVAAGPSPASLTAATVTTVLSYCFFGPWLVARRHERMKLHVDTVKAKGAVPASMGLEAGDPGLTGGTIEETALRRAIHALTGVTPLEIPAFHVGEDGGFTALVVMPPGRNTSPEVLIKKQAQLAANLGMTGTLHLGKGDADNQLIVRLVASNVLAGTIPYEEDGGQSMADPVRIGWDEHGQPVNITLLYRHTLIAGASDWGKSGILNLIIKRMVRRGDVDIYGIDMKPGSVELGPWEPLMKRVAKGAEEARELIGWLHGEAARRGRILANLQQEALARGEEPPRKWVPGVHGNGILLVTDELAELVRQDEQLQKIEAQLRKMDPESYPPEPSMTEQYESGLAIWRFLAISVVAATQQPSRKVFGGSTDARGNYSNRISTRMGEAGHAQFIFGQGCQSKGWKPELLDLPGKFLVNSPELENSAPRVCRAEYVTDADIAADVAPLYARNLRMSPAPGGPVEQEDTAPTLQFRKVSAPPRLYYPDGSPVGRDEWPDLYREFQRLGSATKEELTATGPFNSRDTVRRALEVWEQHGVLSRKEGRATRYYLPAEEEAS